MHTTVYLIILRILSYAFSKFDSHKLPQSIMQIYFCKCQHRELYNGIENVLVPINE